MSIDRRAFIRSLSGQAVRSIGAALALTGQVRQDIAQELRQEDPVAAQSTEARPTHADDRSADWQSAEIHPGPTEGVALGAWADVPAVPSVLTEAGTIEALDQRRLPHDVQWVTLASAGEVVQAIRDGVIDGGAAMVGVAVQTVAMVATRAADAPATSRGAVISGAARALSAARPDTPLVREALAAFIPDLHAIEIPTLDELRSAAASRAASVQAEHRALASVGAAWLLERFRPDANVVLAGEFGPAAAASIGTTSAVLRGAAEAGLHLRVHVLDGEPPATSVALLLAAVGVAPIEIRSVPDVRLEQLLAESDVNVVLLGASWVSADGTLAGRLGSVAAALLARRRGIPVVGLASRSMVVHGAAGQAAAATSRSHGGVPLELVDGSLVDLILTDVGAVSPESMGRLR
ncbi:MAG TPA: hypothetical protein VMQ65_09765 [Candidatus Limnocylindria bacterium]|nr:hypothetical protein [Candidatus Limnocylindria bacterium]